ncbi:MAG: 30S ribosomal protein S6 [Cytophagaceae bacterium]|nr:30S ribosomal protein S6 [Cytophagaceae bacterium]
MILKNYETVFILTPVLSDSQMKDTVEKFKQVLLDNKAQIVNEENWGLKKLAYPIQNKSTGFYQLFEFKASTEVINTLEVEFRRDERVMRFLTTVLDKHALEYNLKRKKGEFNKKSSEKVEKTEKVEREG